MGEHSPQAPGRTVWVLNISHPGAIVRGAWAEEPRQWEYLRRARSLAGGSWEPPSHDTLIANILQHPTRAQICEWSQRARADRNPHSVDIECAGPHLVCVGFYNITTKSGLVVRFRGPAGAGVWSEDDLPIVVGAVYDVLADPEVPKWFHNGQAFDIPYLEYVGFDVAGYAGDTLLLQRFMFPETDATLQGCAAFYLGLPAWKWMAGDVNADEKGDNK